MGNKVYQEFLRKLGDKKTALWVKTDGTLELVKPKNNAKEFSLEELQHFVGGYIEIAPYCPYKNYLVIVNEEGLIKGLEPNITAYNLGLEEYVGNVIIIPRECIS